MKKVKKRWFIFSTVLTALSLSAAIPLSLFYSTNNYSNQIKKVSQDKQDDTKELVPAQSISQNSNLSTKTGPLTFWGNTITALDWYGSKIWSVDMSEYVEGDNGKLGSSATYNLGNWKRAWFNWDYNRNTDTIWILGYSHPRYSKNQKLFEINAITGEVKSTFYELGTKNDTVYFVSALTSGNVMCYGTASISYNATAYLYDASSKNVEKITGDSAAKIKDLADLDGKKLDVDFRWSFSNLIPIAKNINFVEIYSFGTRSNTTGNGSSDQASYDVYFLIVDDKLNSINQNGWEKPKKVASGIDGYKSSKISPQRDYFTLLNGKVATVVYNSVIIIDPSSLSNIKTSTFTMSENKWIQSWTIDANENLYFKFKDDEKIFKIDKSILNSNSNPTLSPQTYLDLSGIKSNDISTFARNFVIYNVYGYTGQLMMINAQSWEVISNPNLPENNSTTKWGLAIGVTQNQFDQSKGDYKGLLNTDDSFQKSADFEINESVLNSKIPSEIIQDDITPLYGSFFKANPSYPSFQISNIKDSEGTFEVTVNLYQIPWFATYLPNDTIPTNVTKKFKTANNISNKVSWKTLSTSTDYDFLNMLPSNLKVDDVKSLDPFQISFQSQTITDSNGNLIYPKKEYSITSADDKSGKVTINVNYKYVPMGITYTGKNDTQEVLTYSQTHDYNIFSDSSPSQFNFMGAKTNSTDNQTQVIDVKDVPQLKSLIEANILPSSFSYLTNANTNKNNEGFLQFINTSLSKGYPVSKISFSVVPNDNDGTLEIKASISQNNSPDKKPHTYIAKYINLNMQKNYKFEFIQDANKFGNIPFNSVLASSVTEGDVIAYLVKYQGFDSNDLNIALFPNDTNGSLTVSVSLNKSYASEIASGGHGFTNYQANHTFSNFMTIEEYNNKFAVEFVDDSSVSLLDFKLMQAQEIYDTFTSNKQLTVGKQTYNNLNDLIEKLLVKKIGSSIPQNWNNNANIETKMYIDNSLGIASFYVKIPQNLLNGASSDLNLIANYSGFVKGNVDQTNDNLSFVSNNMLKNYLLSQNIFSEEKVNTLTPKELGDWIKDGENIKKLITYHTGEYKTKLKNNDFNLTVIVSEIQKTVSVTIDFGKMTDQKSLSSYSIQYIL
ncbi:MAG: hypothetical protein K2H56_00895 [Malacoplasma sp.]|nr:hypothetical protein [Malacoplasma sp.]